MSDPARAPVLTPFGKYLLDEEIARGGMARVYLARLRGLGGFEKKLVVKQIRPELASDPRFVEMFVEEAKTLVQMSHPHIVPVYELGVVDGVYFLAMEHVEGATLAEILGAGGPLPPALVCHLGTQVCDALQYAHTRFGLVHRDVTTRNVIVDALGHARLLDFGIAAKADGTGSGEVFGSHGYMSPEQARGERVGPASDLFSLGVVLYEALTGEPAFFREDPEQARAALLESPAPRLADRVDVPPGLAATLDAALAAEPSARPDSAAALGRSLRGWLASERPEGVAHELATRAEDAMRARRHVPSRPPPHTGGREPSGVVRSIATSVTLDRLLESDEPSTAAATHAAATAPMDRMRSASPPDPGIGGEEGGTTPIDRPPSVTDPYGEGTRTAVVTREDDAAEPVTAPITGRRADRRPGTPPAAVADQAADAPTSGTPTATRPAEPRRTGVWALILAALAGIGAALGVTALVEDGPRAPVERSAPTATVEPRAVGPSPIANPAAIPAEAPAVEGAPAVTPGSGSTSVEPTSVARPTEGPSPDERPTTVGQGPSPGERPTAVGDRPGRDGTADDEGRAAAGQAQVTINATPWAEVTLDGRPLGTTPHRGVEVSSGSHRLVFENPALGRRAEVTIEPEPSARVRVLVDLGSDPPRVTVR